MLPGVAAPCFSTAEHPDVPEPVLGISTSTKSRAGQRRHIPSGLNYCFNQARLSFFLSSLPMKEALARMDGAAGGSQPQALPPHHGLCHRVPSPSTAASA